MSLASAYHRCQVGMLDTALPQKEKARQLLAEQVLQPVEALQGSWDTTTKFPSVFPRLHYPPAAVFGF